MQASQVLINEVKAGFVKQGTTLAAYCRDNKIDDSNAHKVLRGKWNGAKSRALIEKLATAADVEITEIATVKNATR